MASVTFDDDPDRPAPAAPSGIPRITVTPAPRGPVTFEDDPDRPPPSRSRPSDRVRELIAEQSKMSWPAWLNQGAGDFTAAGADMASFGNRPRLDAATGAMTGTYPDYSTGLKEELGQARARAERSPIATAAGNVAGGVAGGVGAGLTRLGTNIAGRLGGSGIARALGFGTEAGVVGAAQSAGHVYSGEVEDYLKAAKEGGLTSAAIGSALGPLTPRSAVTMRPGDPRTGQPIRPPNEEQLQAIVDRGYDIFRGLPASYSSRGFNAHLAAAERDMVNRGVMPSTARPVYDVLENLRQGRYGYANAAGDIGPQQIETARRALNGLKNTTDASAHAGTGARILRGQLEDFVQNPGANVTGNAQAAADAARVISIARPNAAALFRSRQLTDPVADAELARQAGGPPVGEQLVGAGKRILKTKGGDQPKTFGWVDAERERLAEAITPTLPERAANVIGAGKGKVAAAVGGLIGGGAGGVGGIAGGPAGIATGGGLGATAGTAAGYGLGRTLRGFSAGGIQDRWNQAAEAMRARSPAYQRDIRGSVPVAGPGQGMLPQALQGAGASQLGTPYDDGREALVPSMMRQFTY